MPSFIPKVSLQVAGNDSSVFEGGYRRGCTQ